MMVRLILAAAPSLSFFWTAAILSNLATFAALWLIVTQLVPKEDVAARTVAITMMSAGSFYLSIPYTEGLFLLLVVATLVATRERQYELAGLLAGLSATTRVHGVALVVVPALACWLRHDASGAATLDARGGVGRGLHGAVRDLFDLARRRAGIGRRLRQSSESVGRHAALSVPGARGTRSIPHANQRLAARRVLVSLRGTADSPTGERSRWAKCCSAPARS
jgi:hypothetical protein